MDRLISEKAAIDAIQKHFNPNGDEMDPGLASILAGVGVVLHSLPSAHQVIIRCKDCKYWDTAWSGNEAKNYLFDMFNLIGTTATEYWTEKDAEKMREAVLTIEKESVQPEYKLDEWCTDCKEYDYERHCCPRWNRVIRETLKDAQSEPIRINLNEPVKVKLTDWGKEIFYHQFDRTNQIVGREICKPKFPKEDENGYTEFQLWCFIELYGEHMGMTLPNVIEPLEIVYERRTDETENGW